MTTVLVAAITFGGMHLMWRLGYRAGRRSIGRGLDVMSPTTGLRYSGAWTAPVNADYIGVGDTDFVTHLHDWHTGSEK